MFHREFFWDVEECEKFVQMMFNPDSGTFSGLITIQKNADSYTLVDGYQRLIVVTLLLKIICKFSHDKAAAKKIEKNFLFYNNKLRLKILNSDATDYNDICTSIGDYLDNNSQIFKAYIFLIGKLIKSKLSTQQLLERLANIYTCLVIVDERVSASDAYFKINSNLSEQRIYQKIKSTVYSILERTTDFNLFESIFLNMEQQFLKNCSVEDYDNFFTDYITIQNDAKIPTTSNITGIFRNYYKSILKTKSHENILKHMYRYSTYYSQLKNSSFKNNEINREIVKINNAKAVYAYPYLMEVLEDYEFSFINKGMLIEILKTVNHFIENSKSSNPDDFVKTFTGLSKEINKMLALKDYTPRIVNEEQPTSATINQITSM